MIPELRCIRCHVSYPLHEIRYACECGGLLDVWHPLAELRERVSRELFDGRLGHQCRHYASGVWRFKELILPVADADIVSRPEGNTPCTPAVG